MNRKDCETCWFKVGEESDDSNEICTAAVPKSKIISENGEKTEDYCWCKGTRYR